MPESERNDCKVCRRSNNAEDMVFCPECEQWYHYSCVGVDESVQQVPDWKCCNCVSAEEADLSETGAGAGVSTPQSPAGAVAASSTPINIPEVDPADPDARINSSFEWLQAQRNIIAQEMEKQHMLEMERKRMEMDRIFKKAMEGVTIGARADALNNTVDSLVAAGVAYPVAEWMKRMVSQMRDISIVQPSASAASDLPGANGSSTPNPPEQSSLNFTVPPSQLGATSGSQSVPPMVPPVSGFVIPPTQLGVTSGSQSVPSTTQPASPSVVQSTRVMVTSGSMIVPPTVSTVPSNVPLGAMSGSMSVSAGVPLVTSGVTPPTLSGAMIGSMSVPPAVPPYSLHAAMPNFPFPLAGSYSSGGQLTCQAGTAQTQTVSASLAAPPGLPPSLYSGTFNGGSSTLPLPFGFPGTGPILNSTAYPPAASSIPQSYPPFSMPTFASGLNPPNANPFPGLDGLYGAPIQPLVVRTRDQLIARQVISKELPVFSGEPEDWPLFYSSFVNSTNACGYSQDENLSRLQKSLKGKALAAVKSRLLLPQCVPQVLSTLYQRFGRPEVVLQSLLDKVDEFPGLKANDFDGLVDLGTLVENISDHVIATGQIAHLCNPDLIRKLGSKLPEHLLLDWGMWKRQLGTVDLRMFAAYMARMTDAALEVKFTSGKPKQTKQVKNERGKEKNYLNAHSEGVTAEVDSSNGNEPKSTVVCLACGGSNHRVKECATFKKWGPDNRWKIVQENHLCRTCLGKHGRRPCKLQTKCGVNGCDQRHHQFLHEQPETPITAAATDSKADEGTAAESVQKPTTVEARSVGLNAHHAAKQSALFRIVPVKLFWKEKTVETHAFLDDGSSMTLVEQDLVEQLGVDNGEPLPLCLTWTSNVQRQEPASQRVTITIAGADKPEKFELRDTRTVAKLDLPKQTLKYDDLARRFTHLRGLPMEGYEEATPRILIGTNNAHLIATLRLREGCLGEPVAAKTRLGWSIYGCTPENEQTVNFTFHIREHFLDVGQEQLGLGNDEAVVENLEAGASGYEGLNQVLNAEVHRADLMRYERQISTGNIGIEAEKSERFEAMFAASKHRKIGKTACYEKETAAKTQGTTLDELVQQLSSLGVGIEPRREQRIQLVKLQTDAKEESRQPPADGMQCGDRKQWIDRSGQQGQRSTSALEPTEGTKFGYAERSVGWTEGLWHVSCLSSIGTAAFNGGLRDREAREQLVWKIENSGGRRSGCTTDRRFYPTTASRLAALEIHRNSNAKAAELGVVRYGRGNVANSGSTARRSGASNPSVGRRQRFDHCGNAGDRCVLAVGTTGAQLQNVNNRRRE